MYNECHGGKNYMELAVLGFTASFFFWFDFHLARRFGMMDTIRAYGMWKGFLSGSSHVVCFVWFNWV